MQSFSNLSLQFANAGNIRYSEDVLDFEPIAQWLAFIRKVLVDCDGDSLSAINARVSLSRLRRRLVFSLAEFDAPEIEAIQLLDASCKAMQQHSRAVLNISKLKELTSELLKHRNPKRERILNVIESRNGESIALMLMMSFRDVLFWNADNYASKANVIAIDSLASLRNMIVDTIIIPGSPHLMSQVCQSESMMTGHSKFMHIVRYADEWIRLDAPKTLPWDRDRPSGVAFGLEAAPRKLHSDPQVDSTELLDEDSELHEDHDGVPCLVLLFENGELVYVPSRRKFLVLSESHVSDTTDLLLLEAESIGEGDVVAIRTDLKSYELEDDDEKEKADRIEKVCDWHSKLASLLLTSTEQDVAEKMTHFGAKGKNLALSIRNWERRVSHGPGRRSEFFALIKVLQANGRLIVDKDLDAYCEERWFSLEQMRHDFMRQGMTHRVAMMAELRKAYGKNTQIDAERIFVASNGIRMKLARVAAVDSRVRRISPRFVLVPRMRT